MDNVIFKTIHGSHLYGLAHEGSDEDYYTVLDRGNRGRRLKYSKQSIVDGIDSVTVDLGTWLRLCEKGVPQALEAMFSPVAEVDEISSLRTSYRVGFTNMRDTYYRTMENFLDAGDEKRRKHALRLWANLGQASRHGRFNPRLTSKQVIVIESLVSRLSVDELRSLCLSNDFDRKE